MTTTNAHIYTDHNGFSFAFGSRDLADPSETWTPDDDGTTLIVQDNTTGDWHPVADQASAAYGWHRAEIQRLIDEA